MFPIRLKQARMIDLHCALRVAGSTLADVFGMAYLYQQGLPLWSVFLTFAAIQAIPLVVRPYIARLGTSLGLKKAVFLGTVLFSGSYLILSQVHEISLLLAVFAAYSAISSVAYWTPFNIYFSKLTSKNSRGEDVSSKEIFVNFAQALTPILAGVTIVSQGFFVPFIAATLITLASLIPLMLLPDVPLEALTLRLTFFRKIDWRAFTACFAHGWIEIANSVVWPLVVFLLFRDFVIAGVLASLVVIFRTIGLMVAGRFLDHGRRKFVYVTALVLVGVATTARMLFVSTVPEAIFFDVAYAVALCFYIPAFETVLYDSLDAAKDTWQSSVGVEGAYDLGALAVWLAGALMAFVGINVQYTLGLGLVGLLFAFVAFRNFYSSTLQEANL